MGVVAVREVVQKFAIANGWIGNDFWVMLARFHALNTRARVCSTNFAYPEYGQNRFFEGCHFTDIPRFTKSTH